MAPSELPNLVNKASASYPTLSPSAFPPPFQEDDDDDDQEFEQLDFFNSPQPDNDDFEMNGLLPSQTEPQPKPQIQPEDEPDQDDDNEFETNGLLSVLDSTPLAASTPRRTGTVWDEPEVDIDNLLNEPVFLQSDSSTRKPTTEASSFGKSTYQPSLG